ncbi:MAG TPA: apolipoprotein N-acyltransferase [Acidimicrobiales bacterium]
MIAVRPPSSAGLSPQRSRRANRAVLLLAVLGGLLIALSVPPAGFWPLGLVGVGLLGGLLSGRPARSRALIGFLGGLGLYGVTIWWFTEFNFIGGLLSMMVEAAFLAGAAALTPPGRGRRIGWVGALVLQDWLRTYIPFGGVPLGGIPLGQAAGPLAPAARLGGQLAVTAVVALLGVVLETAGRGALRGRHRVPWRQATFPVVAAAIALVLAVGGRLAPAGRPIGTVRIAAVQGGGRRGLRAIHNSALAVLRAQFSTSAGVRPPVDLILWPEDVIALDGPIRGTPVAAEVGQVAARDHAALLAGVTEDVGTDHFRNAEVVWDGTGRITGRYDKVHRVPFGEYIPLRSLVKHVVSLDVIPRDAIPGTGSGEVSTTAGPVGIVISYEVFFPARARSAIRAGGQVLLVPTNTSSYRTTQVPAAEIAAERLRAWETGRAVVMAAPTGWSAVLDARGRLLRRTELAVPAVLETTVERRVGLTPYGHWGDLPVTLAALALAVVAWAVASRRVDRTVNSDKP